MFTFKTITQNCFRLMILASALAWIWLIAGVAADPLLQSILRFGSLAIAVGLAYQLLSGRPHGYYVAIGCAYAVMMAMMLDFEGRGDSTLRVVSVPGTSDSSETRYLRLTAAEVAARRAFEERMAQAELDDGVFDDPPVGRSGFSPSDFSLPTPALATGLH